MGKPSVLRGPVVCDFDYVGAFGSEGVNGMRGGAVAHIRATSSGVRPYAALTMSDNRRSRANASRAAPRAGSTVTLCSCLRRAISAADSFFDLGSALRTAATKA